MPNEVQTLSNNYKISLVIPIYNESQHLEKFLKTIDDINFEIPKELVFIDDKSTDTSLNTLKTY